MLYFPQGPLSQAKSARYIASTLLQPQRAGAGFQIVVRDLLMRGHCGLRVSATGIPPQLSHLRWLQLGSTKS